MKRVLVLAVVMFGCKQASAPMEATTEKRGDRSHDEGNGPSGPVAGGSGLGQGGKGGGRGIDVILDGDLEIATGSIDKDVVRKVVKDNVGKLQYCYEKTLLASPGIEGKVVATFTIGTDGSVTEVKTTGVHPDVESCVAEAVKAFRFPPSGAKVEVSYPFTFKPA